MVVNTSFHAHIHMQTCLVTFVVIIPLLMSSLKCAAFAWQCQGGVEGRLKYHTGCAPTQVKSCKSIEKFHPWYTVTYVLDFLPAVQTGSIIFTSPSVFNGIASSLQLCQEFDRNTNTMACGSSSVIIDGSTGPTAPNLTCVNDIRMFFTWQRQTSEDFLIVFHLYPSSTISSIELYFLSYPTQRIGLPSIQLVGIPIGDRVTVASLTSGTSMNYTFSEVFISQDNTVNKVTLFILSNPGPHGALRLQMSFTGVDNIDWFFLSEVNICTGTIQFQSPSDGERIVLESSSGTPTSVVLNCTVLVAGVFQWRWKHGSSILQNGGKYQMTVADAARTSKLNISQLRFTDAGSYTCEVRHQSQSSYQSRTQELVLPGEDGM